MKSNFKLRFINGWFQGEEIDLSIGTFILGEGGDAVVEFRTAKKKVHLLVSDNGVYLEQFDDVWVEGHKASEWKKGILSSPKVSLPLNVPIDLDGIGILVLPKGSETPPYNGPLPARVLPSFPRSRRIKSWSWPWYLCIWLLEGVLIIAGLTKTQKFWLPQMRALFFKSTPQACAQSNLSEEISGLKNQYTDLQTLSITFGKNGEAVISGRCWESKNLQILLSLLRDRGWGMHCQVFCNDELIQAVRYTLNLFGFEDALVENGKQLGTVAIHGSIQGDARWQQAENMLLKIQGLLSWCVVNDTQGKVLLLRHLLDEAHFPKNLNINQKNNKLLVTGKLTEEEQKKLPEVSAKLKQQLPDYEIIYQNMEIGSTQIEVWPAAVVTIGGNRNNPFIELANGLRLQKGSTLPSGYQIVRIENNGTIQLMMQEKIVNTTLDFFDADL